MASPMPPAGSPGNALISGAWAPITASVPSGPRCGASRLAPGLRAKASAATAIAITSPRRRFLKRWPGGRGLALASPLCLARPELGKGRPAEMALQSPCASAAGMDRRRRDAAARLLLECLCDSRRWPSYRRLPRSARRGGRGPSCVPGPCVILLAGWQAGAHRPGDRASGEASPSDGEQGGQTIVERGAGVNPETRQAGAAAPSPICGERLDARSRRAARESRRSCRTSWR